MAGILDTFTSMMSPDLVDKASRAIDADSTLVSRGLNTVGPLMLGGLTRATATPAGATAIFNALPQDGGGGLLSGLTDLLGGATQQRQASLLESMFGAGTNAISSTLTDKLGFNVRPLISMALPFVLGAITKTVKAKALSAQGLADELRTEHDAFMKAPENKETAGLVYSAFAASDKANALRQIFDEAEWLKVRRAPIAALYHVATASPSGPIGLTKEFSAASDAIAEATKAAPAVSLLGTAFGDGLGQEQLLQFTKTRPEPRALLAGLHESAEIVARKSPADAQAYRDVVLNAARRAAEATKEGGFLGVGGTLVSETEQRALDDIRSALR
jgi:hypothetical protein